MLSNIGYAMLIVGGLLVILSLVLAVVWKVPSLIDELSGRKAKRHIERMRKLNESTGSISLSDTAEFYKAIDKGNLNGSNQPLEVSSELGKLVNDPYGTVGKNVSKNKKVEAVSSGVPSDASSMADVGTVVRTTSNKWNVRIIKEQSSVENKQEVIV